MRARLLRRLFPLVYVSCSVTALVVVFLGGTLAGSEKQRVTEGDRKFHSQLRLSGHSPEQRGSPAGGAWLRR